MAKTNPYLAENLHLCGYMALAGADLITEQLISETECATSLIQLFNLHKTAYRTGIFNKNIDVDEQGMFRAKDMESLSISDVYLGNVKGIWTKPASVFEEIKDDDIETYSTVLAQYRDFLLSNFNQIRKDIFAAVEQERVENKMNAIQSLFTRRQFPKRDKDIMPDIVITYDDRINAFTSAIGSDYTSAANLINFSTNNLEQVIDLVNKKGEGGLDGKYYNLDKPVTFTKTKAEKYAVNQINVVDDNCILLRGRCYKQPFAIRIDPRYSGGFLFSNTESHGKGFLKQYVPGMHDYSLSRSQVNTLLSMCAISANSQAVKEMKKYNQAEDLAAIRANYTPRPVDTSKVVLSKDEQSLVEEFGKAIHQDWLEKRRKEGVTDNVYLQEWEELSDKARQPILNQAKETIKALIASGFVMVKNNTDENLVENTDNIINALAINAHEVWAKNKIASGHIFHKDLVPYNMLDDETKEYDKNVIRVLLKTLDEHSISLASKYKLEELKKQQEEAERKAVEDAHINNAQEQEFRSKVTIIGKTAGCYIAMEAGRILILDSNQHDALNGLRFKGLSAPVDGISVARIDDQYLLVNLNKGELVSETLRPHVGPMTPDGWALVRENNSVDGLGKFNFINARGEKMFIKSAPDGFDGATEFRNGKATVFIGREAFEIDKEGKVINIELTQKITQTETISKGPSRG